jgi:flagellar biosynthesis/type III secretory pathway M-ring protein FliF/YscJ
MTTFNPRRTVFRPSWQLANGQRDIKVILCDLHQRQNEGRDSMKTIGKYLTLLSIAAILVGPIGCKRTDEGEGSAEQAGKKIDKALERAGQETGKLMERAGEAMQKAGENLQDKSSKQ